MGFAYGKSVNRDAGDGRAAASVCLNLLSYKDNTEKKLTEKLKQRGFEAQAIAFAIEYVKEKGYLDERRMLNAAVRSLAKTKLYGRSRITAELYKRGFDSRLISETDFEAEEFEDIDFAENCKTLCRRLGGVHDRRSDAFLRRCGYSSSEIRRAFDELQQEKE